ncbi:MAG: hypothetical protein MRY63_03235 [Neomegalonema sp.]|nr:hypothetical protein [Neomegalonema sp.]
MSGANSAASAPKRQGSSDPMARLWSLISDWVPLFFVFYAALLVALRNGLSPYLEADEAQYFGDVAWQLSYGWDSPPLFHWLLRALLEISFWNWPLALAGLKFTALATYYLSLHGAARQLGGDRTGILALAAIVAMPQVSWMAVHTMSSTVLALAFSGLFLRGVLRLRASSHWREVGVLSLWAALAVLADFAALFLVVAVVGLLAAGGLLPIRLLSRRMLMAVLLFLALIAAPLAHAALSIDPIQLGLFSRLGIAWSWGGALAASAALACALWLLGWLVDRRAMTQSQPGSRIGRWLLLATAIALLAHLIWLLCLGVAAPSERSVMSLLAALPLALALGLPLKRLAAPLVLLAALALLAAPVAFYVMVTQSGHRLQFPYHVIAAQVRRGADNPMPILATRRDDRANLVLALDWPQARTPRDPIFWDEALLLWRGRSSAPHVLRPDGFGQAEAVLTVVVPSERDDEARILYSFQRFERLSGPSLQRAPRSDR